MGGDHACVMVVGHNPGIAYLVELLTGADEPMPTAALAHVELPISQWTELDESTEGKLVNVWIPREL
jgi:phosphohistidine phosphatase